jgi:hypothetical protein
MLSSGMLRRVALVRTVILRDSIDSSIRVTKTGELGTLAITSNRRTVQRCINIPQDGILHSHRHENLTSYKALTG